MKSNIVEMYTFIYGIVRIILILSLIIGSDFNSFQFERVKYKQFAKNSFAEE